MKKLLSFITILLLWEILPMALNISPVVFPKASDVISSLYKNFNIISVNAMITTSHLVTGWVIGISIGVILAYFIKIFKPIKSFLEPVIVGSQIIPKVALIPLLLALIGINATSKITIIVLICFYPVFEGLHTGLLRVNSEIKLQAKLKNINRISRILKIDTLFSLPFFFTGLKTSTLLAVIGVIVAEFLASGDGIGYMINDSQGQSDMPKSFAFVLAITFIGFFMYYFVQMISYFTLKKLHLDKDDHY